MRIDGNVELTKGRVRYTVVYMVGIQRITVQRGAESLAVKPKRMEETKPTTPTQSLRFTKILLGWKTCKHYYETDELTQPKANPTQEKLD